MSLKIKKRVLKKNNKKQKKNRLKVKTIAHIHIFSSHNNTIITLTSKIGDTISWATSSSIGFKGCKKSIHYASQNAGEKIGRTALRLGFKNVNLYIKGFGFGRDYSLRGVFNSGIKVLSMHDITPIPHNGCKIKKIRRK